MLTVYTFGDSILDCGHYNEAGVTPGQLLVQNDDQLFPEFLGKDLRKLGPVRLEHRAQDGSTVDNLQAQIENLRVIRDEEAIALLTIGGNDLIMGLMNDQGAGLETFSYKLNEFLEKLPIRPIYIGNVYDPSFGDDANNFLGVDPMLPRKNLERINNVLAKAASRYGKLVDLNDHFRTGDLSWLTRTIEPSLTGASEIRRCFWEQICGAP